MTTTALPVWTSSREVNARFTVARIHAAARRAEARKAEVARAREAAAKYVADLAAAGATQVGFKVCEDTGKYRFRLPLAEAEATLVRLWGGDVEAWGLDAEGEFVGDVW